MYNSYSIYKFLGDEVKKKNWETSVSSCSEIALKRKVRLNRNQVFSKGNLDYANPVCACISILAMIMMQMRYNEKNNDF